MGRKCLEEPDSTVLLLSLESGQMKRKALKCTLMFIAKKKKKVPSCKNWGMQSLFVRTNEELFSHDN